MNKSVKSDIGMIGLAVMGANLALNIESKGFVISVYNRTVSITEDFYQKRGMDKKIYPAKSITDFIASLDKPRKIFILVKAGLAVDAVIEEILPFLEPGDVIIDGGNSFWSDTERREGQLKSKGIFFIGCGVSGGEEGALKGPSMMPGCSEEAWKIIQPIFSSIAAQVHNTPCCVHIGPRGSGHYVKMVHNGIEYGDIQLICESYAILKTILKLSAQELSAIFSEWNKSYLNSYLIEITSTIFSKIDTETGNPLVDMIMDQAGQKGTGKWTIEEASKNAVVLSTIHAAVEARILSSMKDERVVASKIFHHPTVNNDIIDKESFIVAVGEALYASKIISYAQGLNLLKKASQQNGWNLNFGNIASIWRGGCIIRAQFLDRIREAYHRNPDLTNLLLDPFFSNIINKSVLSWRSVITKAIEYGVAIPAFSASLSYYDSYRSEFLPTNLLQAQRDFFGSHTYQRIDKPINLSFHTEWQNN